VKITADTNILVRAITGDDPVQSPIAQRVLAQAELVAIPDAALCEVCWVLAKAYRFGHADIARVIETLSNADTVAIDRHRVEAGLAMLKAGGDFADGVIADAGQWLGGDTFVSFDQHAVALRQAQNARAMVPQ
jgi:predicted nucleic-acid-binding protein